MSVPLPPITEDQESSSTPPSLHHSTLAPLPLPLPLSQGRQAFEEAKALYESGLYIAGDNPQAAIAHFLQAASVFEELKGQKKKREKCFWQAAVSFGRVGWNAKKRRDWNGAKMAFDEALNLFRMIGDSDKEATTLYQLSLVSFDLLAASDYLKKAALIYTELGNDEKEAMCLAELANLFGGRRNQRDVESSLFHWRQALLLYMKIGDQEKEGRALYSIGEVLLHTDKQAAYDHFLQARVVFRRLANQPKQDGNCSYQLGKICTGQKSFHPAVQFFEESSTLFRQIEAKTDEAWTLYRLALVMLKVDSNDLAVDYLTEARRLFAEAGNERQAEGSCLMRIGEILKDSNPPLAKTLLEEALEYVDPVKERIGRRSTLVLQHLQGSSSFKRSTRHTPMRYISEDDEDEVNQTGEQWSFAGATEEGGAKEIGDERVRGGREGSEGTEGAWWAIASRHRPVLLHQGFESSSLLSVLWLTFSRFHDYALAVEEVTSAKKDTLILNVDGAIAVSFCDLLKSSGAFTPEEAAEYMKIGTLNGLFVLGRSIGFIGHHLDQKRLKQPLYRHPADDIFIEPFNTDRILVKERQ